MDRTLWAVVMVAYDSGVSTGKVDELVVTLGCESGISKSERIRICQERDIQANAFLPPLLPVRGLQQLLATLGSVNGLIIDHAMVAAAEGVGRQGDCFEREPRPGRAWEQC